MTDPDQVQPEDPSNIAKDKGQTDAAVPTQQLEIIEDESPDSTIPEGH